MQVVRTSDVRAVQSEQKFVLNRANDIMSSAWHSVYVCSCATE